MNKFLTLCLTLLLSYSATGQISENMTMHSTWDNDNLPTHFFGTFNEVWGYAANDREYAIMGSAGFIHFMDVTDPTTIVEIASIETPETTVWRDIKTYQDRAYTVSDGTEEGLLIFDLSDLPNSVTQVAQLTSDFGASHNIFIDVPNHRLYAGGLGGNASDLLIYDLEANPDEPTLLAALTLPEGGYMHDLYVRDNIGYLSHETRGFFMWDFTHPTTPVTLGMVETNGYNHSNWVTDDGNYVVFAEEVPTGLPMGIADISNLDDGITVELYFKDPLIDVPEDATDATPHNPYVLGNYVITSYYEDGVIVFDITDPLNPVRVAHYDTSPDNLFYDGYIGCWGVYPYLPSGNIIASDMDHGLFVLTLDIPMVSNTQDYPNSLGAVSLSPNPVQSDLTLSMISTEQTEVTYRISSVTGQEMINKRLVINGNHNENINVSDLANGIYFVTISDGNGLITKKFVKQ